MKILSWYIARTFLIYWLICLVAFVLFINVANLLGNLENAFSSLQGLYKFLDETLRGLPFALDILLPMSVLLATVFTFTTFSRSSELVAMRSAGMGPFRQLLPVFFVLLFISALDYVNQNYLFTLLQKDQPRTSFEAESIQWQVSGDSIYYLGEVDPVAGKIKDVRVISWSTQPYRLTRFDHIPLAQRLKGDKWLLESRTMRIHQNDQWRFLRQASQKMGLEEFPDLLFPAKFDAHHMPLIDLYLKINQLQSQSKPVELYQLEWHQKTAAIFAPFILVWFGAPFSRGHQRKGRASGELVLGILGGLVFIIATEIFYTLGKGAFASPFIAAWSINLIYFSLGTWFLMKEQ